MTTHRQSSQSPPCSHTSPEESRSAPALPLSPCAFSAITTSFPSLDLSPGRGSAKTSALRPRRPLAEILQSHPTGTATEGTTPRKEQAPRAGSIPPLSLPIEEEMRSQEPSRRRGREEDCGLRAGPTLHHLPEPNPLLPQTHPLMSGSFTVSPVTELTALYCIYLTPSSTGLQAS